MRTLVLGGTGKVGSGVTAALRAAGVDAVPAARRARDDGIALDMADADAVRRAATGFDTAFLATPLGPDETAIGLGAVAALRDAGVGKIVYLSIMHLVAMREIPHFAAKIPIRTAILSDRRSVVIEANFFFQNDAMAAAAVIEGGAYPLPVGSAGVWSVDTGDVARGAARAILHDDWNGRAVPVCGAERLTGPGMAATWEAALGRPVAYGGDDTAPFLAMLARHVPGWGAWEADDFDRMMRVTQAQGCPASAADIAASEAVVGRPLTRYTAFVTALIEGIDR